MKPRFSLAAFAALITLCLAPGLAPQAHAGCIISPDGKSIDLVTDNAAGNEKTCRVSCQVGTRIGVVQISCGGHAPPLAKAHALCRFEKPEHWYETVVSFEDTCKGDGAASAAPAPAAKSAPTR